MNAKKKFKVLMRGKNYLLHSLREGSRKHGFYTTAFVEARTPEEAEAIAVDALKNDSQLLNSCRNIESDLPTILIDSTGEISSFENCLLPRTKLVLYVEEE